MLRPLAQSKQRVESPAELNFAALQNVSPAATVGGVGVGLTAARRPDDAGDGWKQGRGLDSRAYCQVSSWRLCVSGDPSPSEWLASPSRLVNLGNSFVGLGRIFVRDFAVVSSMTVISCHLTTSEKETEFFVLEFGGFSTER
jgi:hypothetical protein